MADDVILQQVDEPTYLINQEEVGYILTEAIQGPPGPAGGIIIGTAGAAIMSYTAVVMVAGLIYPADPTNPTHAGLVVGIARTSATTGNPVQFRIVGELTGGSFAPGVILYVGLFGVLSASPFAVGAAWFKEIGVTKNSSTLIIDMQPSILI